MARRRLTRARIVAAALQIADRDGLEAVTLRRLATRLGVHVTSLYNHVPTKDAVLDGMVECMIAESDLPTGPVTWEQWVRRFAAAIRVVAYKHPGAFAAFHHRPARGPKALESSEAALSAFRTAGFNVTEAYNAVKSTSLAVLGLVLDDVASLRTPGLRDLSAVSAQRFPYLHEANAVAAGADTWTYLLDVLVKGFAAHLRNFKPPRRHPGARPRRRNLAG